MVERSAAYARCAEIAARHYENFPVASWLVPRHARPHVAAIYAFARGADDLADEGRDRPERRLDALRRWREWLHEAAAGRPLDAAGPHEPVFVALGHTIRERNLPVTLFDDLLSAFAQDVTVQRYARWDDLLDYCRRSANPVGRLVLRVFGYADDRLDASSDALCTALQLTNFWQDLARDWEKGRLYVPEEEWAATGATVETFVPERLSAAWKIALRHAAARTRASFSAGRAVCDGVRGRLRYELRLTWLGGVRVLDRVEAVEYDVARRRPTLGARDVLPLAWGAMAWRRRTLSFHIS